MSGEKRNRTGFIVLISLAATIGGFLFGFYTGVINGAVEGLRAAFGSADVGTGFNVASMLLGCAAGAFIAGGLADQFGRRKVLLYSAVLFILSALGSGAAGSSFQFVLFRVLGGLAVGATSVLCPTYVSEVAPARYRGTLASLQQIAIVTGILISYLSNYFITAYAEGPSNVIWLGYQAWQWMFWMGLIPSVIFFVALLLIPESPRFLVARGKKEQALRVMNKLMEEAEASQKLTEIEQSLASGHRPSIRDVLGPLGFRPIVWVGIILASFQQFIGVSTVYYYGELLWQSAGFTESHALLINIFVGVLSIGASFVALMVIDRLGRKPLLLIGSLGMAITLGIMAWVFGTATIGEDGLVQGSSGIVALVAAMIYVVLFNLSWGPVLWVMLGEMFPNQMRGSALGISGMMNWVTNFTITMLFPVALAVMGLGRIYTFYALCALVSFVLVTKFVRETKGVELEDMKG